MNIDEFILKYYNNFRFKSFVIDLFTIPVFLKLDITNGKLNLDLEDIEDNPYLYFEGRIFQSNDDKDPNLYFISNLTNLEYTKLNVDKTKVPLIRETDKIKLTTKIPFVDKNVESTIGRLIVNLFLVEPFKGLIPYHNESGFSLSKIESEFRPLITSNDNITEMLEQFYINLDYLSSYSSLFSPSLPVEAFTSNKKVTERKQQLFKQHADAIAKNDQSVTIAIEQELSKLDNEAIKDNPDYDIIATKKTFTNIRKRMFSSMGNIEPFGDNKTVFCKSNLDEGLDIAELPVLFNEIRRGVYNRGSNTALSGADTKNNSRIFQDIKLAEEDCGTTNGIKCTIAERDVLLGRSILKNNKTILMTEANVDKFINIPIVLRSPMYCKTLDGNYCYSCGEYLWKLKNIKLLNTIVIGISSTIMMLFMKAQHYSVLGFFELDDIDEFIY
jgi:hypothetical protein